jgi:hypothetical protein
LILVAAQREPLHSLYSCPQAGAAHNPSPLRFAVVMRRNLVDLVSLD